MQITAYELAQRFTGIHEVQGPTANPAVMAMLRLDSEWPKDDEVPWCSAFVNYVAWLLRLPRSKDLRARSWLGVGLPIARLDAARVGFDVVILNRGGAAASPDVIDAPGHVGFFAGIDQVTAGPLLLGGNQNNGVSLRSFPAADVLGVRRLKDET
ncbi:MAG TPA: TIGR02594 family protein [Gemmatimonadales bacterium]